MFLIAGVQPRTKKLNQTPRSCPACGLARAYEKRIDHYLSLFFIPLIRVKTGEPFLMCEGCNLMVDYGNKNNELETMDNGLQCTNCGRELEKRFQFCPYCGQRRR